MNHRLSIVQRVNTVLAFLFLVCVWLGTNPACGQGETGWDLLPGILSQIQAPEFPKRDFSIVDFGAESDGKTDCKTAIDGAIQECAAAGGGRVVIPSGKWFVAGPIHLKSHVNLHLEKGSHVLFSTDPPDYLPVVLTRFEATEVMNYSPLVYAIDQEDIAVTGSGILDGQAGDKAWWPWKGGGGGEHNQTKDVIALCKQADDGIPVEQRVYGDGHYLRPSFIEAYRCRNVLIEGVTIHRSPMWILHPVLSTNVIVRGVNVETHGPNNDGCDPECCRNVLIEGCRFDTGDDCIAIKSGRNAEGRRIGVPSENIIVRDCDMADGHGGVVLGSEMSGGIRNVFVENCRMNSPNLDRAIRLKSNPRRGGYLENLFVRNIEVGEVRESVLHIDLEYFRETGDYNPTVKSIFIENVTSQKSNMPLYMVGIAEQPIENVRILNCTFLNTERASILEHVRDVHFFNVSQPR